MKRPTHGWRQTNSIPMLGILANLMKKQVKVKPNSKQQRIVEEPDGSLTVSLRSPPTDGKANAELIQLLAHHFNVSRASVTIKTGFTSKVKWVDIDIDGV